METLATDSRQGTAADAVMGVVPDRVMLPDSVEGVAHVLEWANDQGAKVVPTGAGTKLDRGVPPERCDILLDLSRIAGVIEHAAGDMTVTVRAGTRLADLQEELARAGQFLAIDPPVPGTVGGLIATGDSGPRRLRYGGMRDMLLGVTFVRADGTVARAGSKVVKNVAGYDLPKLLTGSLGTLGVIVEAIFRLYPVPPASVTAIAKDIEVGEAASRANRLLASGLVPSIVDYYAEGRGGLLAARFESSPRAARGQAERALAVMGAVDLLEGEPEQAMWGIFNGITSSNDHDVLARLISTPSDLPTLLEWAQQQAEGAGLVLSARAHMGHGHALLHFHEPAGDVAAALLQALRAVAESRQSSVVIWRAPREVRHQVDVWGDPGEGFGLMRSIKRQFDPKSTLNPGRFVGGI